jgi:hypothetical protein
MTTILSSTDHSAIERLLAAYVLSLDMQDIDVVCDLFVEDGVFVTYGREFEGARLRRMFETAPQGMHLGGRALATGTDTGAAVRSQLLFLPADRSEHRLSIYDDEVVKVGERWLFRTRRCRFINSDGVLRDKP